MESRDYRKKLNRNSLREEVMEEGQSSQGRMRKNSLREGVIKKRSSLEEEVTKKKDSLEEEVDKELIIIKEHRLELKAESE